MPFYQIDFEPTGRRGSCPGDKTLLDCARQVGAGIISICGGYGDCKACKIRIMSGKLSKPTSLERQTFSAKELKNGWRLACQAYPASDCKIDIPVESMTTPQRTQTEGLEIVISPEPAVLSYEAKMTPPEALDLQADASRLLQALNRQNHLACRTIDIGVLRELSPKLRSWNWTAQASVHKNEVIALSALQSRRLGLAMDLGSTKIAGYLVDLSDGRTVAAKGATNPQISYGEDIVSRIYLAVKSPSEGKRLQELAVQAINKLTDELCKETGAETEEILDAVVAGNTAMHHLLLGLPVNQLAYAPYIPAVKHALDIKARDAGLNLAAGAYVHFLPNIAGFVGGDHVAMLLATKNEWAKGLVLALDIGTNTEVSLIDKNGITAVSCASGPAFEGGHIKHGMRAASGAIERLRMIDGKIQYQTINGVSPVGICGSGILDALAQLYLAGILDKSGRMAANHPRVHSQKDKREFSLVNKGEINGNAAIVITQQDIRELQLAKGAIRAGIQMLLEAKSRSEEEISHIIIGGAFGSYIDVESAIVCGLLPSLPLDRFKQVGNAAGMGSKLALVSAGKRAEAKAIASRVRYLELSSTSNFRETFIQASYLGRYRLVHGKRIDIE